ncbi:MAG: pimeloyl-ACP methyl ester carboxylesterase/DNA-binding CsgD family transcriptional regulator [Arenicella sp.]|jgi:pimeloyl-ACP methyl ester carboxylesterase/DNA-binding CsgD family transcriptional regulator
MNNSRFSSLIYRIIGKPDRWHEDYLDVMNQILDETDSFDEPYNFTELEVGDRIISTLKQSSDALNAVNTLMDKSCFKMVILNKHLKPIYYNQNAEGLFKHLLNPSNHEKIKSGLEKALITSFEKDKADTLNALIALDYTDENDDQIYLRSIQSKRADKSRPSLLHFLMVPDQNNQDYALNRNLIDKYEFTDKEQKVVQSLIHGHTIKEIAEHSFVSDNTVKTHLKAIFRKTDTNSQTSVVLLVLTHESQILDSYFESDLAGTGHSESSNNDREITLEDGHKITYCDYGPKHGRPLIVFHSGYGCRLSIPRNYYDICERNNRRIIILDRPGIGKTPYIKNHPEGWNNRFLSFIDRLGLEDYELLASIIGAQLAVNLAADADQRLKKLILCAPIITNKQADIRHLTGILSPTSRLVKTSKRFATEIYQLWLKSVSLNLETHYKSMLQSSLGSAERDQFKSDGTLQLLIDVFKEAASADIKGISSELIYCLSPMNLDFKKIHTPIEIWYGSEDKRISLKGLKEITKELPNCKYNVREGYSEHIYYGLFEEIIR